MVLKFADGAVKAAVGVLGVLQKGGPIVGDLVIFVYTHGHMGRGLKRLRFFTDDTSPSRCVFWRSFLKINH